MDSAPQLLREDRPEFERVLDEALRTAQGRTDLKGAGRRLNAEQLRTMALSAAVPIAACAAVEYQRFVALREELRRPGHAGSPADAPVDPDDGEQHEAGPPGARAEGLVDATGAGLVAVVSVLAPLLAGAAAVIFLLVGYVLHMLTPEPAIAEPMRDAGWVFGVLAAGTALVGMAGLLLAAVRNGSSAIRVQPAHAPEPADDLARARAAWRDALLERGILPFLREALADPPGAKEPASPAAYVPEEQRTPRLGYSHPRFSSSGGDASAPPRFSSPDYSSPEYGGPEYGGPEHGGSEHGGPGHHRPE